MHPPFEIPMAGRHMFSTERIGPKALRELRF
jgi:hypothetical protein